MEHITSRKNETVRRAAALLRSQARRKSGMFLCEGARLCADAADSGLEIRQAFYTLEAAEKYAPYLARLLPRARETFLVEPPVAALLADTRASQGVYCVCALPPSAQGSAASFAAQPAAGACVALERIQDPSNLGTILRTAEALGVCRVLLCGEGCDPFSPKALRGGMGAAFRLQLIRVPDLAQTAPTLQKAGWTLAAAVPDAGAVPVTRSDFSVPTILAVGNEGAGLLPETVAACDLRVTIPMRGRAESLNASASAAILLWELMRRGDVGRG